MTGRHRAPMSDLSLALARFGAALTVQQAAFRRLGESIGRVGLAFGRALIPPVPIPPHAFTPDYDLACVRCPRTAEEH